MSREKYTKFIPTAEPFYFPGGSTGCLLTHGFTGTPKEMRWLGEYLAGQGHSVLGVRLAAHATQPEDMMRSRWWDWLASVEDGWHFFSGCTERIFLLGLSMGGILSLTFAAQFPVAGVVAMATPHHMPDDPRIPFISVISKFQPYIPKGPPNWFDMQAYEQHTSYSKDPTRAYAELRDLMEVMHQSLPQVTAPVLLIYAKDDTTVRPEDGHLDQIYEALGSQDKRILTIENSGHIVTEDTARQTVFEAAANFIMQNSDEKYEP